MGKQFDIAFRLGAELESNFSRTFNAASGDFKDLQRRVSELSRARGTADTARPIRDDLSRTRSAFGATESAANKLGGALKRAVAMVGGVYAIRGLYNVGKDLVQTYAEFEQEMQNVKALSGATTEELAALTAQAKQLNATTQFTGKQAGEGMAFLAMAGFKTNDILAAMPGLLNAAAAGKLDLGETADITSNILQGFGIQAEETGRVADVLTKAFTSANVTMGMIGETMKYVAPQSKAAGISLEETAAAAGLLGNAGIQASMAGTGLRSIIARMAAPTGGAAKLMKKLGIQVVNADGSIKSLADIVEAVTEGTKDMGEAQRISAIKTMAGQYAASSMLTLMDTGADKLREFTKELEESGGVAERIAKTQLDSFSGSMTLFKSAVEAAKISIGEKMAPAIRAFADGLTKKLPGAVEAFEKRWKSMTESVDWNYADGFGKFSIAWDKLIGEPMSVWWASKGKAQFSRIATEIGKTIARILKNMVKEAFSFNGATSFLAAGALAIPGMKIGKGITGTIRTLAGLGRAGGEAAGGVGAATRSAGLFTSALGLLANPVGAAIAGVGLLAGGVYLYKRRQESARQELINMGEALKQAAEQYEFVAAKSEKTKALVDEYKELSAAVEGNVGTAEELAQKQERLTEVIEQLQSLHPNTINQYDVENGKIKEKLGLLDQEAEAELELAKLRLEKEVAEKGRDLPALEKEIMKLHEQKAAVEEQKDAYDSAIPAFKQYWAEFQRIMEEDASDERTAKLEALRAKLNEVGETVGYHYNANAQMMTLEDTINSLEDKQVSLVADRFTKAEELNKAKSSYEELYNAQLSLIEMDLGGKMEDQAKKFIELSDEEKERFNAALKAVTELNNQMLALPENKVINVEVLYSESGQPVPSGSSNPFRDWSMPKSSPQPAGGLPTWTDHMPKFADGGLARKPSIFAEAGPEFAIPYNNNPRSHSILDTANRLMGHSTGDSSFAFAPQITIQGGGGSDVRSQVDQALRSAKEEFERWWENKMRQERRLSFNG